jgi:hypothetical protein
MLFLSLLRSHALERAASVEDKDAFYKLLPQTAATCLASKRGWMEAQEMTEEEKKVLVLGCPANGVGVWVLRFASDRQLPRVFGRRGFAMNMEEKIQIMRVWRYVC